MADFDSEMQRALELSAQEHMATQTTVVLDSMLATPRHDLGMPCSQHWRSPHAPATGVVMQLDTLNQFAQHWAPVIHEFKAPSSICGYMAIANAMILQKTMPAGDSWSKNTLKEMLQLLRDPAVVEPIVREAMHSIAADRKAWLTSHASDFPSEMDRKRYLSAWVANYEISDFFQAQASIGQLNGAPIHFARYNQWPMFAEATGEERVRLLEEQQFGGCVDNYGAVKLQADDSMFLVESFTPSRRLDRPEDFLKAWRADQKSPETRAIFVADLNGHFVTCVAIELEWQPALLVFNTTNTIYSNNATCAFIFDLIFPPNPLRAELALQNHPAHEHPLFAQSSASATCDFCNSLSTAYRCSQGCDWDLCADCFKKDGVPSDMHSRPTASFPISQITAMGFSESQAHKALAASGGNVEHALELLLG